MNPITNCEHIEIDEHACCVACGVEGHWYWDERKCWSPNVRV